MASHRPSHRYLWVRNGACAGAVACAAYPALILLDLPSRATVLVVFVFAAALALASVGLYHFLRLHSPAISLEVAVGSNILASFAFAFMGFTQLAVRYGEAFGSVPAPTALLVDRVQLGLDVVWDAYLAVGTLLFAVNMRRHPKLGRVLAWTGALVAAALFAFNFATFPLPPAASGLVDVGPLVGLWYLAITIQVLRSLDWFRKQESA